MSISIQEHIDDIKSKINVIKAEQELLATKLAAVEPLRKELRELEDKKDAYEGVLRNLEHLRGMEPDVQAVLNPADPFGDAG